MRVLNHIVNEDGHALAQPHLKVLPMRHVAGLLAEMLHWQCFDHYRIREQKEGIAIPLNPYMVDVIMGGEEIRDLHPWGGIRLPLSQPPDVVAAPQSLFFSRPGRLYWRKLGEDKVHEVDQPRQGYSGQKLPEQGKQSFRFVLQSISWSRSSTSELMVSPWGMASLPIVKTLPPSVSVQVERCSIAFSMNCSSSGLSL